MVSRQLYGNASPVIQELCTRFWPCRKNYCFEIVSRVAVSLFAISFAIELQCFKSDQQAVLSVSLERKGRQNQTQNYDK